MDSKSKPEEYLQQSFEKANDGILILRNGIIQYANPKFAEMLEYSLDESIGTHFEKFISNDFKAELLELYERKLRKEKLEEKYEAVLTRKSGTQIYVEISASFIQFKGKDAELIFVHDISRLKKSIEQLKQSEEKYRSFFKTSKDCVFFTSREGRWLDMSDSAPAFFGYASKEELMEVPIPKLYHKPEQRETDITRIQNEGFTKDVPIQLKKKDGSVMDTLVTSLSIVDRNGEVYAYQGVIKDITQQKKDERDLKRSKKHLEELNASKDKFFSIIGHDLRTPFNAIIGFSELLWKEDFTGAETRKIAEDLYRSGKETFELLNNLLDWSRSETGKIKFTPSSFKLRDVVESIVSLFSELAFSKNIKISNEVPKDMQVFADENMIMTIIRNLVSNAIKFTPTKGQIIIQSVKQKDGVQLSVLDTGVGIPEPVIAKIFELDKDSSTKGTNGESGSGLGLLLCKEFAEKNNVRIQVKSVPGEGSNFTLLFPIKPS